MGTSKTSFTNFNTSDTNSFRDALNDKIIFIASFIPAFFHQLFLKVFIWVSNLNLSRSLLKSKDIAKVQGQNLLHATLLKAVFPLSEEFQSNISAKSKILAVVLLKCRYKFYRNFSFFIMIRNFSFLW